MWLTNDRRVALVALAKVGEDELLLLDEHRAEPRLAARVDSGAVRHRVGSQSSIGYHLMSFSLITSAVPSV